MMTDGMVGAIKTTDTFAFNEQFRYTPVTILICQPCIAYMYDIFFLFFYLFYIYNIYLYIYAFNHISS